jgi:hypothetical protein
MDRDDAVDQHDNHEKQQAEREEVQEWSSMARPHAVGRRPGATRHWNACARCGGAIDLDQYISAIQPSH